MKLSNPLRVRVRYLGPTAPSEIRPPAAASYPTRLSDPGRRVVVLLAECFGDCSVTNDSAEDLVLRAIAQAKWSGRSTTVDPAPCRPGALIRWRRVI